MSKPRPTIRDVARLADVSISTVSLALNSPERVSEATRSKVAAAAKQVGYSANPLASSLKKGSSRLIGFVTNDITNPFFGTVLQAIEKKAAQAGYMVIVCDTHGQQIAEANILDHLSGQRVAGIILSPTLPYEAPAPHIAALRMPFVLFDHKIAAIKADFVGTDNALAASMLTEHLIRLGHRRIAFIGGIKGLWTSEERQRGFLQTMQASGLEVAPELCLEGHYEASGGYEQTMRLMSGPQRPTAVLAANNMIALGALQACNELSIRCPDDISLVGIDDVPWSNVITPRITMTAQPITQLADDAFDMLLQRIEAEDATEIPPREVVHPPRLVMGSSTRRLSPAA